MRFFRLQSLAVVLGVALALGLTFTAVEQTAYAQAATSSMTGQVTDQSGAAIPNVAVTLTNATTGAKFTQTTNSQGFYRFTDVPPGEGYVVTFSANGFAQEEVKGIYLTVSTIRTQNATLQVSARAEKIEVTASNSEVTIDTTSAQVGITVDVNSLNNLPVQQRNDPTALFTMQPGVTDTGAVAGARVDQNYVTLDGLDVNDIATGGAEQNNTGAGVFSGFGSGNDRRTCAGRLRRGVSRQRRGSACGHRSGKRRPVPACDQERHEQISREPERVPSRSVAGGQQLVQQQLDPHRSAQPLDPESIWRCSRRSDSHATSSSSSLTSTTIESSALRFGQRIVPLDSLRNGNIGYCTNASSDCSTTNSLSAAQVAGFDPAGVGESSTWLSAWSARFPHSNNTVSGDGINTGGYAFNAPNNDDSTNYVARIDYNLNQNMKIFGRFTISRENAYESPNQFAGDPATDPFVDRSYAFVDGAYVGDWLEQDEPGFPGRDGSKALFPEHLQSGRVDIFHLRRRCRQCSGSLFSLSESERAGAPGADSHDWGRFLMDPREPHDAGGRELQGHPGSRHHGGRLQHDRDWLGRADSWALRADRG